MKYLILLVFLLTNSCLIVEKAGKGHGKMLTNSIEVNTEGAPGVINAIMLAATIAIHLEEDNASNRKLFTETEKQKRLRKEEEKTRYEAEQEQIKLNQAKNANQNFKRSTKNTAAKRTISGNAKKGTIVNAYSKDILIASAVSDKNGIWSIEIEQGQKNYDLKFQCWKDGPENVFQC